MKVPPRGCLFKAANAYPAIIAGVALVSGLIWGGCELTGVQAPEVILLVFMASGTILAGLIGVFLFILLVSGVLNGITWLVKRCRVN
jgi:hypothetical protein